METLYRKVAVSERKPTKSGDYFTNEGLSFYASTYKGFEHHTDPHRVYPDWWLEPIPDPTAQLKADKEELLEALENCQKVIKQRNNLRIKELDSLIQKHKP